MNFWQIMGFIGVLFGVLIIVYPNLLSVLVGTFFIVMGVSAASFGGKINGITRR